LGGFSSHLLTPNSPELKTTNQSTETCKAAKFDEKRALFELNSDIAENVSTPTRVHELAEFNTNSDSENLHFSETLGKYVAYLKSKIVNSKLLDGVDQVSRSIEGCIKLAESALGSSKTQQNPEALSPPQEQSGDILSGIDQVDSKLINCIKMAESTQQNKKRIREEESAGNLKRQTPGLLGRDCLLPENPRILHRNLLASGLLNQLVFLIPYSIKISTSSWTVLTTLNHSTILKFGQITSTCSWMVWLIHSRRQTPSGNWPNSKRENLKFLNNLASRFSINPGLKS
jgi:hypothetical protein